MSKRLYRSRDDRMLFGVAGGMARYLDIDSAVVRVVWALLVIAGGAGLLLYIVAAIVIPEEPAPWATPPTPPEGSAPPAPGSGASTGPPQASGGPAPWSYRAGVDRRNRGGGAVIFGVILVLVGAWLLLRQVVPQFDMDLAWPVILLVLGGALVIGAMRRDG